MTAAACTPSTALRVVLTLTLALLTTWTIGCGGRQFPAPDDALTDPVALLEATDARLQGVRSLRLRATLEYYGTEGRARIRQAVVARAPDAVRMESISPFDTTLSVLVIGPDRLAMYDVQGEQFISGRSSPTNIARLVPFRLSAGDVVRVLLGAPPLELGTGDTAAWRLAWDETAGFYRWTMPTPDGGEVDLLVQHRTWVLAGAALRDATGTQVWELRAGDFETVRDEAGNETTLPGQLRFLMPSENVDLSLDVDRFTLNPALDDALFQLVAPRGVTTVDLDDPLAR